MRATKFHKLLVLLAIVGVLLPMRDEISQAQETNGEYLVYLPAVARNYPPVNLTDIWVGNADGYQRSNFLPGEELRYIVVGENNTDALFDVDLSWNQIGPCGETQIFTGTLSLEPGLWVNSLQENAPDCLGTYTNTVLLTAGNLAYTQTTTFDVVNFTSEVVFNDKQGFDKCGLPTIDQMQTWWDHSPYWVFNIYLGGSSFACNNPQLNADWVWQVSQQGWEFILTWVGPQAPCFDTIKPKINPDKNIAYQQGLSEADLAIAAADFLSLKGDKIIYYDVEGYTTSDYASCREPVDWFLTGWTERLQEKGFKAGAYGSPCRSFVSDWWNNTPRLDDIWIARWSYDGYDPTATVWGNVCNLTDSMWANNQRLRQYAGDHSEVWGDLSLGSIDSNVLLGEITAITTTTQVSATKTSALAPLPAEARLREAQLLTSNTGWVLKGQQLLRTQDTGKNWDSITPVNIETILQVDFIDSQTGWLVALDGQGQLVLHHTRDGGNAWERLPLSISGLEVDALYLDFVDAQTGYLVGKIPSSSNFSLGQLFATSDGGHTWEERSLPLGEPVAFSNAQHGWVTGGPMGNEFYYTEDGGQTWATVSEQAYRLAAAATPLANLPPNTVFSSQPDAAHAWALSQSGDCASDKTSCWQQTQLWMTTDGGQTWLEITP